MSQHLPECIYTPEHFDVQQNIVWNGKPCICEEIKTAIGRARWQALDDACSAVAAIPPGQYAISDALIALNNLRFDNE